MDNNNLLTLFYNAFQKKDFKTMQNSYTDNAVFGDPVFQNLNALLVRKMWEMFCVRGKGLKIEFTNVQADEAEGSAEWKATYIFSATGRKVINHIKSSFIFENGKILKHTDTFDFYAWAKQAFGVTGLLLGWSPLFKNKVRESAINNLKKFIEDS